MDAEYLASQTSQNSTASTIPYELFDSNFANELECVDTLYFGNVANSDVDLNSESDESDNHDSDIENKTADLNDSNLLENNESVKEIEFKSKGCKCKSLHNGIPCCEVILWDELIYYRNSCLEKTKDELDMIIKFQLYHHRSDSRNTDDKNNVSKARTKYRHNYYFHGFRICHETFSFAHGISYKTVKRISKSLEVNGLNPRVHGNVGRAPKHALSLNDVSNIKQFLIIYGQQNGLPLPGRLSKYRNEKYILLPSDLNKADIHSEFCKVALANGYRGVCLSEFKRLWLEHCPYLIVMKPSTDLCVKCQKHVHAVKNSGNLCEEEKIEKLELYQNHIEKVKCQRDHYRNQCEVTKAEFSSLPIEKQSRGTNITKCCNHCFLLVLSYWVEVI